MPRPAQETAGFSFKEIPLDEALHVVYAGDGKYSHIKKMLLKKLPQLAPDKAYAFGLPSGKEMPEKYRRSLCTVIGATLQRADLNWRITYSGISKMFICLPRNGTQSPPTHATTETNGADKPLTAKQLIEKAKLLFGYNGDFKRHKSPHVKVIRKAISVVGVNQLGLKPKTLARLMGISSAGVYFNAHLSKSVFGNKEIEALQNVVRRERGEPVTV